MITLVLIAGALVLGVFVGHVVGFGVRTRHTRLRERPVSRRDEHDRRWVGLHETHSPDHDSDHDSDHGSGHGSNRHSGPGSGAGPAPRRAYGSASGRAPGTGSDPDAPACKLNGDRHP